MGKLFEALFFAACGFDGFVVGLNDVGFMDDPGKLHGLGIFDDGKADTDEFFNDFEALVEVGILCKNVFG